MTVCETVRQADFNFTGAKINFDFERYAPYVERIRPFLVPSLEKAIHRTLRQFARDRDTRSPEKFPRSGRCSPNVPDTVRGRSASTVQAMLNYGVECLINSHLSKCLVNSVVLNRRLNRLCEELDALGIEANLLRKLNVWNFTREMDYRMDGADMQVQLRLIGLDIFLAKSILSKEKYRASPKSICEMTKDTYGSELDVVIGESTRKPSVFRGRAYKRPSTRDLSYNGRIDRTDSGCCPGKARNDLEVDENTLDRSKDPRNIFEPNPTRDSKDPRCRETRKNSTRDCRGRRTGQRSRKLKLIVWKRCSMEFDARIAITSKPMKVGWLKLPCQPRCLTIRIFEADPSLSDSCLIVMRRKFENGVYNACSCLNGILRNADRGDIAEMLLNCEIRPGYVILKLGSRDTRRSGATSYTARVPICQNVRKSNVDRRTDENYSRESRLSENSKSESPNAHDTALKAADKNERYLCQRNAFYSPCSNHDITYDKNMVDDRSSGRGKECESLLFSSGNIPVKEDIPCFATPFGNNSETRMGESNVNVASSSCFNAEENGGRVAASSFPPNIGNVACKVKFGIGNDKCEVRCRRSEPCCFLNTNSAPGASDEKSHSAMSTTRKNYDSSNFDRTSFSKTSRKERDCDKIDRSVEAWGVENLEKKVHGVELDYTCSSKENASGVMKHRDVHSDYPCNVENCDSRCSCCGKDFPSVSSAKMDDEKKSDPIFSSKNSTNIGIKRYSNSLGSNDLGEKGEGGESIVYSSKEDASEIPKNRDIQLNYLYNAENCDSKCSCCGKDLSSVNSTATSDEENIDVSRSCNNIPDNAFPLEAPNSVLTRGEESTVTERVSSILFQSPRFETSSKAANIDVARDRSDFKFSSEDDKMSSRQEETNVSTIRDRRTEATVETRKRFDDKTENTDDAINAQQGDDRSIFLSDATTKESLSDFSSRISRESRNFHVLSNKYFSSKNQEAHPTSNKSKVEHPSTMKVVDDTKSLRNRRTQRSFHFDSKTPCGLSGFFYETNFLVKIPGKLKPREASTRSGESSEARSRKGGFKDSILSSDSSSVDRSRKPIDSRLRKTSLSHGAEGSRSLKTFLRCEGYPASVSRGKLKGGESKRVPRYVSSFSLRSFCTGERGGSCNSSEIAVLRCKIRGKEKSLTSSMIEERTLKPAETIDVRKNSRVPRMSEESVWQERNRYLWNPKGINSRKKEIKHLTKEACLNETRRKKNAERGCHRCSIKRNPRMSASKSTELLFDGNYTICAKGGEQRTRDVYDGNSSSQGNHRQTEAKLHRVSGNVVCPCNETESQARGKGFEKSHAHRSNASSGNTWEPPCKAAKATNIPRDDNSRSKRSNAFEKHPARGSRGDRRVVFSNYVATCEECVKDLGTDFRLKLSQYVALCRDVKNSLMKGLRSDEVCQRFTSC
ncbi:hypothetical protein KM043_004924 [Ampulex compressa]|nr:hypothetical protein KM043_004924 [Ampulex compressa]